DCLSVHHHSPSYRRSRAAGRGATVSNCISGKPNQDNQRGAQEWPHSWLYQESTCDLSRIGPWLDATRGGFGQEDQRIRVWEYSGYQLARPADVCVISL